MKIITSLLLIMATDAMFVSAEKIVKAKKGFKTSVPKVLKKGSKTKAPNLASVKNRLRTTSPNLKKKSQKKALGLSASPTSSPTSPLDYTSCANPGTQDTCLSGFSCVAGVAGNFCIGSCTTTADCTSKLGRTEFICESTPFATSSVS